MNLVSVKIILSVCENFLKVYYDDAQHMLLCSVFYCWSYFAFSWTRLAEI